MLKYSQVSVVQSFCRPCVDSSVAANARNSKWEFMSLTQLRSFIQASVVGVHSFSRQRSTELSGREIGQGTCLLLIVCWMLFA
jgi:hypothetical protein